MQHVVHLQLFLFLHLRYITYVTIFTFEVQTRVNCTYDNARTWATYLGKFSSILIIDVDTVFPVVHMLVPCITVNKINRCQSWVLSVRIILIMLQTPSDANG